MNLCLFDLDHTLLPLDSDHEFGEFLIRCGLADETHYRQRNNEFYRHYQEGTLVLGDYIDFTTSIWRHLAPPEQDALQERFMADVIRPALRDRALDLVRSHREAGDLLAIVTATNEFVTAPIARAFDIEHLIAVKLVRDAQGRVTGAIDGVPSFREGKIERVNQWLHERGQSLSSFDRVSFYSDSPNDLPLLEHVSDPVATNPSPALEAEARVRGWRLLNLFS